MNTAEEIKKIQSTCRELKTAWSTRHKKITDWYKVLTLEDKLKQEGMESVVSNDPRTGFNLALHLLTSSNIAYRIPTDGLAAVDIPKTSYLEDYMTLRWRNINHSYRLGGRQSYIRDLVSLMLSTGWYAVFALATEDELISNVWHPDTVYPEFGEDGLTQVAHMYTISTSAALAKARKMGWILTDVPRTSTTIMYDWWFYDIDGDPCNSIVLGNNLVKPAEKSDVTCHRIPVFTSPVGGLPDQGVVTGGKIWQEHYGEAIIATNESLIHNYNRMLTFTQQLVRDTANPRWFEQSSGETPILREEDMFKRGAIFRGAPGESVQAIPLPALPVELTRVLFEYQNMSQRGLFPWVLYGNLQQQLTGVAMSQIASAALEVLTPYQIAIKGVLSDVTNFWLDSIKEYKYKPYRLKMPTGLDENTKFDVDFNIDIPGFLLQRATAARMLDPNFRLSTTTVMDILFPEIKNPLLEQARVSKDDAQRNPVAVLVDTIQAYREAAKLNRDNGDTDTAELYEMAVEGLLNQLKASGIQPKPAARAGEVSVPREVLPEESTRAAESMVQPQEV